MDINLPHNNNTADTSAEQSLNNTILSKSRNRWKLAMLICLGIIGLMLGLFLWKNHQLDTYLTKVRPDIERKYQQRSLHYSGLEAKNNALIVFNKSFDLLDNYYIFPAGLRPEYNWDDQIKAYGNAEVFIKWEKHLKDNEKAIAESRRACSIENGYYRSLKFEDEYPSLFNYTAMVDRLLFDSLIKERDGKAHDAIWQIISLSHIQRLLTDSPYITYNIAGHIAESSMPVLNSMAHRNKFSTKEILAMQNFIITEYEHITSYADVIENDKNWSEMSILDSYVNNDRRMFYLSGLQEKAIYYIPYLGVKWHVVEGLKANERQHKIILDYLCNRPGAMENYQASLNRIERGETFTVENLMSAEFKLTNYKQSTEIISRFQGAILILGIERYYSENGKYPENIAGLIKPFKNVNAPLPAPKIEFTYTQLKGDYQLLSSGPNGVLYHTPWNAPQR